MFLHLKRRPSLAQDAHPPIIRRQYVWFQESAAGLSVPTARPGRDGQTILYTQNDRKQVADLAGTVRVDLDGEL